MWAPLLARLCGVEVPLRYSSNKGGVETTREEHTEGHVCHQALGDRLHSKREWDCKDGEGRGRGEGIRSQVVWLVKAIALHCFSNTL